LEGLPNAGPLLLVLAGPSGVGKDAVLGALRARLPSAHFAVTATTRTPRPGEQHGVDYYFLAETEFRTLLAQNGLIEHEEYANGRLYGVPRAPIAAALAAGQDVLLRTDVRGAQSIKRLAPAALTVFLYHPGGLAGLQQRMQARGEDAEAIAERLAFARAELATLHSFDYAVANADGLLDNTVAAVLAIIAAERLRVARQPVVL
jgi:guanylate kinase